MKSLVTGGAGFIGSNLVDELLELGHSVVCVDNESSEAHNYFNWNSDAVNVKGDIRDYHLMKSCMENVDYVFHLAAEARIQPAINNPINAVSINSLGTCTVLQTAREAGVKRVIYSSTSSAYGFNDPPNLETQPDDCLNPYSVSKVSGEKLCHMYTKLFDLPTVTLRYFNVYGERQPLRGQYAPVVGIFLRQYFYGQPLTIVGDGEQRRDFTHVSDVVNANIMCAIANQDEEAYGQVYNVGSGKNYSVNELAALISDNTTNIPPRIGESRVTLSNTDKIYDTFGWKAKVQLEDWIRDHIKHVMGTEE